MLPREDMRVPIRGGGMCAQTDVSTPDGGWMRKDDVAPLLPCPRLKPHPAPLEQAGASRFPSACVPPPALSRDPFNLQVLQAFVDCHEFANLNLVQALR